jgi:site-specific DNA-cytosine methylase
MKQDNQDNSLDPTKVTVGCLFAAIGGFVKAFKQKGATILWANETDRWGIRKLTPRECARLQGYEDSWFRIPVLLAMGVPRLQLALADSYPSDRPFENMICL